MNYMRVIPRDFFNEGNLLKCLGQLYLKTESRVHVEFVDCSGLGGFEIMQDPSDGSISCANVFFKVSGRSYHLYRPLNSREPYPLYLVDDRDEDNEEFISVFNDDGSLSGPMLAFLREQEPLR